ncbi:MAG: hypothetical protein K9G36_01530 [Crocinitomicaceae bacterium]|nr:hypothetical protein [Crocinitomicaceae bacterium]MCF8411120.1 hypothetical protein [Crocinitomicaceae bacterium]MCF8445050.1 hypothetical protein [Crocinitomicaceae bacterium]
MTKLHFTIKYLVFTGIILFAVFAAKYFEWLTFGNKQFLFLGTGFLSVSIFSLVIILPAIGKKSDAFVFQFLLLTVGQLLFMLSYILFEIYTFENHNKTLVITQLTLFMLLLIFQTSVLYKYSRNQA